MSNSQAATMGNAAARSFSAKKIAPYLFVAPFLLLFIAFIVAPLAYALYMSLFRDTLVGGRQFAGAAAYIKVAGDAKFWGGVWNLVLFGIVQVPIMLGLALLFAIVLDRGHVYGKSIFRLGFFLPYAVPSVIATIIWGYLYGPTFGPFTQLAKAWGLPPPDFLSPGAMVFSLANIVTWEYVGYNMVIFYAALKAIPSDLSEAARIDGASSWQFARLIQLPLLWPAILLTIIFSINGTLQLFNEPWLMRALARNTINSSYTPNIYAYSLATANQQYGYAAAVSFVLGVVIAGASYIFTLITNRRRPEQ
jgi:multiple sugar transport system permease protein